MRERACCEPLAGAEAVSKAACALPTVSTKAETRHWSCSLLKAAQKTLKFLGGSKRVPKIDPHMIRIRFGACRGRLEVLLRSTYRIPSEETEPRHADDRCARRGEPVKPQHAPQDCPKPAPSPPKTARRRPGAADCPLVTQAAQSSPPASVGTARAFGLHSGCCTMPAEGRGFHADTAGPTGPVQGLCRAAAPTGRECCPEWRPARTMACPSCLASSSSR